MEFGASLVAKQERICWLCKSRRRHGLDSWVGKIPWKRTWQPTSVLLPGESHGQRSLVGYSPQGHKRVGHANLTTQHTCTYLGALKLNMNLFYGLRAIPYKVLHTLRDSHQGASLNKHIPIAVSMTMTFIFKKYIYLFICLQQALAAVPGTFHLYCGIQDLSLWCGVSSSLARDQTQNPHMGGASLSHWTTREVS